MSLNWNAFLTDDALNISIDPWGDIAQQPTDQPLEMPKSRPTRTLSSPDAGDNSNYESLLNDTGADSYMDDSLFGANEYFLSDLEALQTGDGFAGESTEESSPEPPHTIPLMRNGLSTSQTLALLSRGSKQSSPSMAPPNRPQAVRANTFPNPQYESMFPNNLEAGFVEDLHFPDGPNGTPTSLSTKPNTESPTPKPSTDTTAKRQHKAKPDILSACWTSPLCPNHDQNGPPPNPSNCGAGCAPFLFADDSALPTSSIANLLNDPQETIPEEGVVEIKSNSKKRSESAISHEEEPSGRRFSTTDGSPDSHTQVKSEDDSQPQSTEDKSKPRRRLPHNQVERKYRESLNTQLESLRRVVPSLQQNRACDGADIEDLPAPSKPSKAVILASATAHIKQVDKERKSLQDENAMLRARVKALQALVKCDDCSLMQYVIDLKINQAKA